MNLSLDCFKRYEMKRLAFIVFGLLMAASAAGAAEQEKLVTLAEVSNAAGLNVGAQQRLIRKNIDLKHLALGIAEAYSAKSGEDRMLKARESVAIFAAPTANGQAKSTTTNRKNVQQANVDLGLILAVENQEQLKTIDIAAFMAGFKTGYTQNIASPQLATSSIVVDKYLQQVRMQGAEERLMKAQQFLAENANRKGVIMTTSGLQYEILQQGNGVKPTWQDMVKVNYRHTKPDSDFVYDSAAHNHSETMAMRGTIPKGWHELFLLMNKGSRYRVYLPPSLGWGEQGNGDNLLPNEVLITEFTLLDVIPPPPVVD